MPYTLIKEVTKTSDQEWYVGLNIANSLSSTPDPRDSNVSYTDEEKAIVSDYANKCLKLHPGYLGWDREYIGENLLRVTYYFTTEASARTFRMRNHDLSNPYYARFLRVLVNKEKELGIAPYTTSWALYDEQGNTIHSLG